MSFSLFGRKDVPAVRIRLDEGDGQEQVFAAPFRIGRDEPCEVRVASSRASRCHAEVVREDDAWWLRDLGSTNGTYLGGRRIQAVRLGTAAELRFGTDGPRLTVSVEGATAPPEVVEAPASSVSPTLKTPAPAPQTAASPPRPDPRPDPRPERTPPPFGGDGTARRPGAPRGTPAPSSQPAPQDAPPDAPRTPAGTEREGRAPRSAPRSAPRPALNNTQAYVQHYFGSGDRPAGEHTQMIRRAYESVHRRQRRRYGGVVAIVGLLCVAAVGYALWQHRRADRAEAVFYDVRAQEAEIARIRTVLEDEFDASLAEQLQALEAERARAQERYEGFIEEYGIRRELSEEEQVIFKVSRIFNESHAEMPPEFVRAVREEIRVWQTTRRGHFLQSIRNAETSGYTGMIVQTFQKYGLPPEFFYLGMQESGFRPQIVGPWTRFGHAKGMWQFIPETGAAYGLRIGPRQDEGVYDEGDERHDPLLATDAAARYLRDIYGQLAQASGLLAMASYNWGERRVIGKLNALMEGIPDDPQARSYWRFYSTYSDRMPEETKDYVIKIFSAAVIGENPRLFGFDIDNPLRPYMETQDAGGEE